MEKEERKPNPKGTTTTKKTIMLSSKWETNSKIEVLITNVPLTTLRYVWIE